MLHGEWLLYLPEIIRTKLIKKHHDNPLAGYFGFKKTWELVARNYYWPTLQADVEAYVKECDICMASKAVKHKLYKDLELLPVPTYRWKDLFINFISGLPVSTNWKGKIYNSILVIIDRLTKMIYYKPIKVTRNAPILKEVIINMVVRHHSLTDLIISDCGSVFSSNF